MEEETVEQMLLALAAADNKVATVTGLLKEAQSEYQAIEDRVFAYLDKQGSDQIRSTKAGLTVSIQESDVYTFDDMEAFTKFVLRNKSLELFQRRLSAPAVRALMERRDGKPVPGLGTFKKRRLHVNKVRGK